MSGEEKVFHVQIHDEGSDGLWAEVDELPGVFASGQDEAELNDALEEAIGLYLSTDDNPVTVRRVDVETREQRERFLVGARG